MNIKSPTLLTGLSLCSTLAVAAPYQTEINAAHINYDDSDDFNLHAAYYFSPVDTDGYPLAEAAFLDQASGVYLGYDRLDSDFEPRNRVNLGFEYYIPNSIIYIGANVVHITELKDGFESDGSDTDWGLTFGIAPIDRLLVTTSYGAAPKTHAPHLTQLIQYFATISDDNSSYDFNLSAKYVAQLPGDTAISITATYADKEWGSLVSVRADYYFNPNFSVGVWMEDLGTPELEGYGVRTEKFFTDRFSVQASYVDFDNFSSWSVGAALRF